MFAEVTPFGPEPMVKVKVPPAAGARLDDEETDVPEVAFNDVLVPNEALDPKLNEERLPFCTDIFTVSPFAGVESLGSSWPKTGAIQSGTRATRVTRASTAIHPYHLAPS